MTLRSEDQKNRDEQVEKTTKTQDETAAPAIQDLAPRKIDLDNADQVKGGLRVLV